MLAAGVVEAISEGAPVTLDAEEVETAEVVVAVAEAEAEREAEAEAEVEDDDWLNSHWKCIGSKPATQLKSPYQQGPGRREQRYSHSTGTRPYGAPAVFISDAEARVAAVRSGDAVAVKVARGVHWRWRRRWGWRGGGGRCGRRRRSGGRLSGR